MGNAVDQVTYSKYVMRMEDQRIINIDPVFTRMLGYTEEDVETLSLTQADIIFPEEREEYFSKLQRAMENRREAYFGHRLRRKDGEAIFVFCYGECQLEGGEARGRILITDVTNNEALRHELSMKEMEIRLQYELLKVMAEENREHFLEFDADSGVMQVSVMENGDFVPEYRIENYMDPESFLTESRVYPEDREKTRSTLLDCLRVENKETIEIRVTPDGGMPEWYKVHLVSAADKNGRVSRVMGRMYSIQKEREKQEMLKHQAERDSLTGIYNHNAYVSKIRKKILSHPEQKAVLFMLDIDNFKLINDSMGHQAGDQLLERVAKLLEQFAGKRGIAGRMGGDEFSVWIQPVAGEEEALSMENALFSKLSKNKSGVGFSVSIGASVKSCHASDFTSFYHEADQALYDAKRSGKNQYRLFGQETSDQDIERFKDLSAISYLAEEGLMLDDVSDLIYLFNPETYEMIYMNRAAKIAKNYREDDNSWLEENCYKIIYDRDSPCENCHERYLTMGKSYVEELISKDGLKRSIVRNKTIRYKGNKVRMKMCTDISKEDKVKEVIASRMEMEEIIHQAFMLIADTNPSDLDYRRILSIPGEFYGADCVCMLELQDNGEWKMEEWHSLQGAFYAERFKKTRSGDLAKFSPLFNSGGLAIVDNINTMESLYPEIFQFLLEEKIWSLYAKRLMRGKKELGRIFLINPKNHLGELRIFNMIGFYLASAMEQVALWREKEYEVRHDKLTGALNRSSYMEFATNLPDCKSLGLIYADVNDLTQINNDYGYEYGNRVVKDIAEVLISVFTEDLVFRFDGDDFVICCIDMPKEEFYSLVDHLKDRLSRLQNSASVGSAWDNFDLDIKKMCSHAQVNMNYEQQKFYSKSHMEEKRKDMVILNEVVKLIDERKFVMYLQPKVDMRSGAVTGAEALVRLQMEPGKVILPIHFISVLEKSRTISSLDFCVLEQACEKLAEWGKKGLALRPIAVNFSRVTFLENHLTNRVADMVSHYGVPRSMIEIEITESIGDLENDRIMQVANELHDSGFRLSMDDFGSKYSSISTLSLMKVDEIKLDRSMLVNLEESETGQKVIKHVIAMSRDIGIHCIVEGIERKEQEELILSMGCETGQGYYYYRPMPAGEFEKLLQS